MLPIVIVMIVILGLAGLVLAYAAYPHRGQELPAAPWLGDAMGRAAEAAPTLDRSTVDEGTVGTHRGAERGSGERAGRGDVAERRDEGRDEGQSDTRSFFFGEDHPGFFR